MDVEVVLLGGVEETEQLDRILFEHRLVSYGQAVALELEALDVAPAAQEGG